MTFPAQFKRPLQPRCHQSLLRLTLITLLLSGIRTPAVSSQPNWQTVTFERLPTLQQSGQYQASPAMQQALGFDPSRQWLMGQRPEQALRLGDFADSFQLQQLTLNQIAALSRQNLQQQSLRDLRILQGERLSSLLQALPNLRSHRVLDIPLIRDLVQQQGVVLQGNPPLITVLRQFPSLSKAPLARLPLNTYSLGSVPGLMQTPLHRFPHWQRAAISDIPGLKAVPFAAFPKPVMPASKLARVDVVLGNAENEQRRTVTGSYRSGFQVPCQQNCAHLELGQPFEGYQWISGLSQQVPGGHGVLGRLNHGQEPTGRHPLGQAFKLVLTETHEAMGQAQTALYFRICLKTQFVDLGCSPYFLGPVPWSTVQEGGWIVF